METQLVTFGTSRWTRWNKTTEFDALARSLTRLFVKLAEFFFLREMWSAASYHSMMISRHFLPWCMFSYRLRIGTMCGPADTRQWSSTSRLAFGLSYRIWEADGETDRRMRNLCSDRWGFFFQNESCASVCIVLFFIENLAENPFKIFW